MAKKPPNIGELVPGSNDWLKAFDALSPQDQAAIFNFSFQDPIDTGEEDFGAGFDFGPGVAGTAYSVPSFLGGGTDTGVGLDPLYQQVLQFGGGVNLPQFTSAGKLDPYDLGQEQARNNLYQDQVTSLADVIMSSLAGPGALDPRSFAPIVTMPTDKIKTPGLAELDRTARGSGYKAFIARKMRDEGMTDDEATAALWNFVATPVDANASKEARDLHQSIVDSLPSAFKGNNLGGLLPPAPGSSQTLPQGQRGGGTTNQQIRDLFNEAEVGDFARALYTKSSEDLAAQAAGWEDPNSPGTFYTEAPTQEDSPLTQKFHNLGLPTPIAQYNDPEYLQMAYDAVAPDLQGTLADRQARIDAATADTTRLGREASAADTRYEELARALAGQYDVTQATPQPGYYQRNVGAPTTPQPTQVYPSAPPTTAAGSLGPSSLGRQPLSIPGGVPWMGQDMTSGVQTPRINAALTNLASTPLSARDAEGWVTNQGGTYTLQPNEAAANKVKQSADTRAMFNFFAPKAPVTVERLDSGKVKQSETQRAKARRSFDVANTARYQAKNAVSEDLGDAVRALANANYAARTGRTPFLDAVMQRFLGQRAVGLRGA